MSIPERPETNDTEEGIENLSESFSVFSQTGTGDFRPTEDHVIDGNENAEE